MFRIDLERLKMHDRLVAMKIDVYKEHENVLWPEAEVILKQVLEFDLAQRVVVILKGYLDNPIGELAFDRVFDEDSVEKILKERDFICFLIEVGLIDCLKHPSNLNALKKLRFYAAIINYSDYMKIDRYTIPLEVKKAKFDCY